MRLGTGAGFSSDRLQPAVDLARDGGLDWLVFETIGERTLAFGHRDRQANPAKGFNPHLAHRLKAVLPHAQDNGTRIMTNMGVANVAAAGDCAAEVARYLGLSGLKIALVEGDDITDRLGPDTPLVDAGGRTIGEIENRFIGANAYLGMDAILPAIQTGADLIITGRVADPSLFAAPIADHFGWANDDWVKLGKATLTGHLMECGMQITGGYFADPGFKDVPDLASCGFPIAEVAESGDVTITKLEGTGGAVNARTVKEQLLYEVHDPARYLTPDVTADFSSVAITEAAPDRVHVAGASGTARPRQLKATVGFDGGFLGEAGISYAGQGAARRARLAAQILSELLDRIPGARGQYRIDLIGLNAIHATAGVADARDDDAIHDVRVRVAIRSSERYVCTQVLWEVEALLCCGPAGGGGYRGQITPSVVTWSAMIDRGLVSPTVKVITA